MSSAAAEGSDSTEPAPSPIASGQRLQWGVLGLLGLSQLGALVVMAQGDAAAGWRWIEPLVFVLAAFGALSTLANRLSSQSAFAVAAFIFVFSAVIELMAARSGFPFGRRTFTEALGAKVLGRFAWTMPCVWVAAIVTSRGLARLLMRPFRRIRRYGFWQLGLTGVLTALFDLGLEPFASAARGYWSWQTKAGAWTWHGAPWAGLLGWAASAGLILWFATPWFIAKRAVLQGTDYAPLVLWASLQLYFAAGCALGGVWSGVVVAVLLGTGLPVLALYAVRVDRARRARE